MDRVVDRVVVIARNLDKNTHIDYTDILTARGYNIKVAGASEDPVPFIETNSPVAVCFQFDYPDLKGLATLRLTKELLPSIPLLMITRAHSEQLAVWAFRTRVWDYFVQPVDTERLIEVIDVLRSFSRPNGAAAKSFPCLTNEIPPEARLFCKGTLEEKSVLDQVLTYLDANLHRKIVQAEVADFFGLSTFQFSRLFKKLMGVTFQEYLLSRRIEEAKRLMANPKASVTDICFTVGFQDLSYFTRSFQRYVGFSPSRYRQRLEQIKAEKIVPLSAEAKRQDADLPTPTHLPEH